MGIGSYEGTILRGISFVALQTDIRSAPEQFAIVGVFVIFAWQNQLMHRKIDKYLFVFKNNAFQLRFT